MSISHKKNSPRTLWVLVLIFFVLLPTDAHALYLDPGTGSLVLQVIAAAVLTATVVFQNSWGKLKNTVGRIVHRKSKDAESGNDDPTT